MKRYGLCCISNHLHNLGYRFKTITAMRFLGLDRSTRIADVHAILCNNLRVLRRHMEFCHLKTWTYRMPSNLFPLLNYYTSLFSWRSAAEIDSIKTELDKIRQFIATTDLRVSLHPDQFIVLASANPDIVQRSISELNRHGEFMDMLGLPRTYECPINVHMNSYRGYSLTEIAGRFTKAFDKLSTSVKTRLVLENEDKQNSWTVQNLYDHIFTSLGIPITYDCLHYRCNPGNIPANRAVELAVKSWGSDRPLFHFSGSDSAGTNPRAHADYPVGIPLEYYRLDNVDLDMEFKMKDKAIELLEKKYPEKL